MVVRCSGRECQQICSLACRQATVLQHRTVFLTLNGRRVTPRVCAVSPDFAAGPMGWASCVGWWQEVHVVALAGSVERACQHEGSIRGAADPGLREGWCVECSVLLAGCPALAVAVHVPRIL